MDQDNFDQEQHQQMMNGDQQEYGEEVVDGNGMQVSNALAGQRASKKRA